MHVHTTGLVISYQKQTATRVNSTCVLTGNNSGDTTTRSMCPGWDLRVFRSGMLQFLRLPFPDYVDNIRNDLETNGAAHRFRQNTRNSFIDT